MTEGEIVVGVILAIIFLMIVGIIIGLNWLTIKYRWLMWRSHRRWKKLAKQQLKEAKRRKTKQDKRSDKMEKHNARIGAGRNQRA